MIQLATGLAEVNLQPGELHLARSPTVLQTILGSCVGVTFWSKRLGAGALCHGVLPRCPTEWPPEATVFFGHRYVDFSIRYLAASLTRWAPAGKRWK
jgi:chemotaxis protein CheD